MRTLAFFCPSSAKTHRKFWKWVVFTLAVLVGVFSLVGCSNTSSPTAELVEPAQAQNQKEVTAPAPNGSPAQQQTVKAGLANTLKAEPILPGTNIPPQRADVLEATKVKAVSVNAPRVSPIVPPEDVGLPVQIHPVGLPELLPQYGAKPNFRVIHTSNRNELERSNSTSPKDTVELFGYNFGEDTVVVLIDVRTSGVTTIIPDKYTSTALRFIVPLGVCFNERLCQKSIFVRQGDSKKHSTNGALMGFWND
ncbi:MAG: hypothetical protein PHS95_00740 [Candidatus Pacebacteria bacterium]|nr:hypothetical protein [Candidatus Paceibacterota bacterium]